VESYRAALSEKQDKLNNLLEENEELLAGLYADRDNAEELIEIAKAQETEIQKKIEAYNAQKAAEAEARRNQGSDDGDDSGDTPAPSISGTGYTWPVPGYYYVISPFAEDRGYSHKGIDITGGGIMGAPVVAAESGVVIDSNNSCTHNWGKDGSCGCGGGYGNYILIDHGNGCQTLYGHLTSTAVSSGSSVSKGQTIGYVGSTGWSTGAHLHFETRSGGIAYDPMSEY
jgi:murein DD-endopeptidase MepM/ murein hydrolase activator NlpD